MIIIENRSNSFYIMIINSLKIFPHHNSMGMTNFLVHKSPSQHSSSMHRMTQSVTITLHRNITRLVELVKVSKPQFSWLSAQTAVVKSLRRVTGDSSLFSDITQPHTSITAINNIYGELTICRTCFIFLLNMFIGFPVLVGR